MADKMRKGAMNPRGGGIRLVPGLASVRAGQTVAGRYRVEELIGAGATGVVLKAHHIHLRVPCTLKILASYTDGQEELMQRRLDKARLAASLQSAHVARIVDIGVTEDGMPYVATEFLAGRTLHEELAERGRMPVEEAARWVLEACEGLAEAHGSGLVHGDLKPQNLFLAEPSSKAELAPREGGPHDADPRALKILDFGTTSPLDAIADQSASAFFGSPAYLAPEQIQDPAAVGVRVDVWALGVLLHHLVSGKVPFEADTLSGVLVAVVYDAPGLLTDAPYELARLVHRCLDKDPTKRPQNVKELAEALAPFAGTTGARLSERVRVMLDSGADASGSMPPVSVSLDRRDSAGDEPLPLPLATKRERAAETDEPAPTRPSRRVAARRRSSRVRGTAVTLLGAAAAIAVASFATTHPWAATAVYEHARTSVGLGGGEPAPLATPATAPAPAVVPALVPRIAPIPAKTTSDLPDAPASTAVTPPAPVTVTPESLPAAPPVGPPLSFAATSSAGVIPTPLATTATPLATAEPLPPRPPAAAPAAVPAAPPAVLPAPRVRITRATTPPARLPAGLPTTRGEPLPPYGTATPRPPARPADESYVRKLFTDRK
jgi:serine/threonine protein kinase